MLAHSNLAVLVALHVIVLSLSDTPQQKNPPAPADVSVLESKDALLQMLEKKLKEIKDHKKQRDTKNDNGNVLPKNVDFKLKSNGINAIGETELLMRHGKNGQGTVNMTADGISNVGKIQLVVGLGDNGINIPGLGSIFGGLTLRSEDKNDQNQLQLIKSNEVDLGYRRQNNFNSASKTDINTAAENIEAKRNNIGAASAQASVAANQAIGVSNTAIDYEPAVNYVPLVTQEPLLL